MNIVKQTFNNQKEEYIKTKANKIILELVEKLRELEGKEIKQNGK